MHGESGEEVREEVGSSFMEKSLPSFLAHLRSKEFKFSSSFLCLFTGKFDLKSWLQESKVRWNSKVVLKHSCISVESEPKDRSSSRLPHGKGLHLSVLIKMLVIVVELTLRINILEHFSGIPPFWVGLHHNGIRADFLNEFLSSLGKHGRLICRAN